MVSYEFLYWVCLFFIALYVGLDAVKIKTLAKFALYIPLILLLAFTLSATFQQFDIGTYERIYNRLTVPPASWRPDMFPEWGYQYINYFANEKLGLNFAQFRFVLAGLALTVVFWGVSLNTRYHGIFFLLYYPKYFLIGLISHFRSGLVNPFILVTLRLASTGRYWRVFFLSLVLSQIHLSALLLNGISILSKIKLRMTYVVLLIPFSVAFGVLFLPFLIETVAGFDIRQINYLTGNEEDADRALFGIEFIRRCALVLLSGYLLYYGKLNEANDQLIVKTFLASVFFYIGFHEAKFISDRVGGMLGFVEPLVFIVFIQNHRAEINRVLSYFIVITYAVADFLLRAVMLDSLPGHFDFLEILSKLSGLVENF